MDIPLVIWGALSIGLVAGIVIGITTDFYTSIDRSPAKRTAESSQTGAAINIITGFSYGLVSMFPPLLGIGIASAVAYFLCELGMRTLGMGAGFGVYGVGMSAVGMLSIVGMIVAGDAYGPIVDNSRGIAEERRPWTPRQWPIHEPGMCGRTVRWGPTRSVILVYANHD